MPTSGPSANALSYSTRAERPSLVVMIRSQPIEHDAQLSRTAARSSSSSVVVSVPKLWPGSAESALNDSRFASVPRSRYFAVAGPNERARRSLEAGEHRLRIGDGAAGRSAHGDGLQPLGAQDGAEAAAAGVAAVVGDRRVAHEPLAGRPDRGDAVRGPELLAQPGLGLRRRQAPQVAGVDHARAVAVDDQRRRRRRTRRARRSRRCRSACRRSRSGSTPARRSGDTSAATSRRPRTSRSSSAACRRAGRTRTRAAPPARAARRRAARAPRAGACRARRRRAWRAGSRRRAAASCCLRRRGRRRAPFRSSRRGAWVHCTPRRVSPRRRRP